MIGSGGCCRILTYVKGFFERVGSGNGERQPGLAGFLSVDGQDDVCAFAESAAVIDESQFDDGAAGGKGIAGYDRSAFAAEVVVCVCWVAVLQVEGIAGGLAAFGDDNAICAAGGNRDVRGEGVRAVACGGSQCVVEMRRSGIEGVEGAAPGRRGVGMLSSCDAGIDGVDVVRLASRSKRVSNCWSLAALVAARSCDSE